MWKDDLSGRLKNNRSPVLSVRLPALISALFLSLLCGIFYNSWKYEVERIQLEEGGWQSRITGELDPETLESIRNFPSVREVAVNEKESQGTETAAELYFYDYGTVFSDTPRIAALAGVPQQQVVYNYPLLAMYLIRDSKDTAPRLIFPMFLVITALASLSLIVILHNAFAFSMNARIRQFGIFSSVGATPRQIRTCLLQETAVLCAVPVLAGNVLGIAGSMRLSQLSNILLKDEIPGRHPAVPGYHPLVLILTLLITMMTIGISAWLPARKLSRMTPLEAIRNTGELQLKRRKNSPILTLFFGVEGELAGNALKAQRSALRTASFSLISAFLAFTLMQCFFSLSGISTRETYFEKYQSVWDIMVTLSDTGIETFGDVKAVQGLPGVERAVAYQKAAAKTVITEEEMSEAMKSFGGFSHASEAYVTKTDSGWLVNAPILILDDRSFSAYCEQLGITPRLDGAVVLNQIRDVTNPDFRHPDLLPYLKTGGPAENAVSILRQSGREDLTAELPVLSYTREVPPLREEYATIDHYELVHFIPASLWKQIRQQIGGAEKDLYLCVLGGKSVTPEALDALEEAVTERIGGDHTIQCENRIREYETNQTQIQGMMFVMGGFCVLLAVIGIGNVFSNTLGFVHQRKREIARYLSIGMTPGELRRMFCIEALVIAGRPILFALPPAAAAVGCMLKMSYLEVSEFLAEAPLVPVALFMLAILGSVALAYAIAWRNVRRMSLAEVLRDDTML